MESRMPILIGAVVTLAAIALGAWWFLRDTTSPNPPVLYEDGEERPYERPEPSGNVIQTTYDCPNGDMFITEYDTGSNDITLETDDRTVYILPQIVSEAGARYAKFDGSVEFYEEDGRATVTVDGEPLHEDCEPMER